MASVVRKQISGKRNDVLQAICIKNDLKFNSVPINTKSKRPKFNFTVYGISEKDFKKMEAEHGH